MGFFALFQIRSLGILFFLQCVTQIRLCPLEFNSLVRMKKRGEFINFGFFKCTMLIMSESNEISLEVSKTTEDEVNVQILEDSTITKRKKRCMKS